MIAASAGEAAVFSISFSSPTAEEHLDDSQCKLKGSTALSMRFTLPIRRKSVCTHSRPAMSRDLRVLSMHGLAWATEVTIQRIARKDGISQHARSCFTR